MIPSSAYLHIPFCRRRCYYCDFAVSVVGDRQHGDNSGTIQQYVEILIEEINTTESFCQPLETIFFGGGTPSLLSVEQVNRILTALARQLPIAAEAEISLEVDPGTFTSQKLQGYQLAGVNRFSLGIQAFQDDLLASCGRSHNVNDIFAAIAAMREVGVSEWSIDLISGLPHQTITQWEASLVAAIEIRPTHISSYDLIIEPKTVFARYYQPNREPLPTEETTAQMYRLAQQMLTDVGYQHYEISNYALPGHQCRHNRVYWENRPYYAFGMGATSYVNGYRFTRPRQTKEYYNWVRNRRQFTENEPNLSSNLSSQKNDILLEKLMLGLRLSDGIKLSTLAEEFGEQTLLQVWNCLQPYYDQGWVDLVGLNSEAIRLVPHGQLPKAGQIRLTDPEGFLFSNTVLAALFSKFSD